MYYNRCTRQKRAPIIGKAACLQTVFAVVLRPNAYEMVLTQNGDLMTPLIVTWREPVSEGSVSLTSRSGRVLSMNSLRLRMMNRPPVPGLGRKANLLSLFLLWVCCNAAIFFWAYTLYTGPILARNKAVQTTSQPTCAVCGNPAVEKAAWEGRSGARVDPSSELHYCLAHYPRTLYQPKSWSFNLLLGVFGLVLMFVFLNLSCLGRTRDWHSRWIDAGGFLSAVSLLLLFACFEYW